FLFFFFFQAEDGIRDRNVTGVQTCALPILLFSNSGSEANELALRIARQHTGHTGVLVSDFSYHGNTTSLAAATTGLEVHERLGRSEERRVGKECRARRARGKAKRERRARK